MQSGGELQYDSQPQMTPDYRPEIPLSSVNPPVPSPSVASSPPLTAEVSKADITSLSDLRSYSPSVRLSTTVSQDVVISHQQAILAKKIRLGKLLSRDGFFQNSSAKGCPFDDEDARGDIRVLSPSLVNSQVLPKTRPLSPDPLSSLKPDLSNGKSFISKMGWKELGSRRKIEGGIKGGSKEGKECQEDLKKEEDKEGNPKGGKGKGRRRPRNFKLKFHHQALPPEYLDHYEASLRQEQRHVVPHPEGFRETLLSPRETLTEGIQATLRQKNRNGRNQRTARPITIHEAGGGATEALLRDLILASPHLQQAALQQAAMARAQSVPSIMLASVGHNQRMSYPNGSLPIPSPDSSIGAEDRSSYASDMSVDEFPKRRRKPKKNDSNHLMGGSGFGGIGLGNSGMDISLEKPSFQTTVMENSVDTENIKGKTYTSLLYATLDQNEPLNLCIRDESPRREMPLTPCDTNICTVSHIKREPLIEDDGKGQVESSELLRDRSSRMSTDSRTPYSPSSEYPTWTFGGNYFGVNPHWIHDYRLKTEDGLSSGQSTPSICSQSSHLPCMSPPTWPHLSPPPQMPSPHPISPAPPLSPLIHSNHPRHIQALIKESLQHRFEDVARERLSPRESLCSKKSERNSPLSLSARDSSTKSGARRKRSALFIPPADPSTEVSICKFKFTGGANPMLEEKKMVSVDAGGTLRYFTGGERTLIKDSRNSPNLRLSGKLLENLSKCEKDVKKIRLESDNDETCSLPGGRLEASCSSATTSPTGTLEYGAQSPLSLPSPIEDSPKRKRRSKKSSVREKLEQTLREKGLLIQTQQVESAEGATYCKFRQLRKITRYLFRSWKDYLPGQMHDGVPDQNLPNRESPGYNHSSPLHTAQMNTHEYSSNRR